MLAKPRNTKRQSLGIGIITVCPTLSIFDLGRFTAKKSCIKIDQSLFLQKFIEYPENTWQAIFALNGILGKPQ